MPYIVIKHPSIRIDLMVRKEYQAQLVSYMERMGVRYEREETGKLWKGREDEWVKLIDISGENGKAVGEMLGLFYSLEWNHLAEGADDKFYILLRTPAKGRKKNADKNRKKDHQGSNSGNSGEPAGYSESGPVGGPAGNGNDAGASGDDDLWESPRVE